jgi:hypothetical protein
MNVKVTKIQNQLNLKMCVVRSFGDVFSVEFVLPLWLCSLYYVDIVREGSQIESGYGMTRLPGRFLH